MLIALSTLLGFIVLALNINKVYSNDSILFKELSKENNTIISIGNYKEFYLYLDISSLDYKEEGILTFQLPIEIKNKRLISSIYTKVIQAKNDEVLKSFPVNIVDTTFQYEMASEVRNNPAYESPLHLYFNKTIDRKSNVFLLIDLVLLSGIEDNAKTITIFKLALLEDITFSPFYGKIDFIRPITPLTPIYVSFDLKGKFKYENIFIYCQESIMTVYYDYIVKNNRINRNMIYTRLVSSDQYYLSTEENSQHKRFILKFLTAQQDSSSMKFSIGYIKNPLILFNRGLTIRTYPIEITKQNQRVFMVGLEHSEFHYSKEEYYLNIEQIYGIYTVHYSPDFSPNYLLNDSPNILNSLHKSYQEVNDVMKIESNENFIQISCASPCKLNIIIFTQNRMNRLYSSGIFYYVFTPQCKQEIMIKGLAEFSIEIETLSSKDEIAVYYLDKGVSLNKSNRKMRETLSILGQEKNFSVMLKAGIGAYIKVQIYTNYNYTIVPLGKSEYFMEKIVFILEPNVYIDSYVIEIKHREEYCNEISYFHECFGIGDNKKIPFHYTKSISVIDKRVFTIANPYDKINKKAKLKDNEFYYYELEGFDDNLSPFIVNYYNVYKGNYTKLKMNTPVLIDFDKANRTSTRFSLVPNYTSEYRLILLFHKPRKSSLGYTLYYNSKVQRQSDISAKRYLITLDNYYVDYSIDFNMTNDKETRADSDSAFVFSYSYCSIELLEDLLEIKNHSIRYSITEDVSNKGHILNLQWNTYLLNVQRQEYRIYITKYNEAETNCSFIQSEPYSVVNYSKPIKERLLNYTATDLKDGVYRVNIIAQENKMFNFTQIYDEVIVAIGNVGEVNGTNDGGMRRRRRNMLNVISVVLAIGMAYLIGYNRVMRNKGMNQSTRGKRAILI